MGVVEDFLASYQREVHIKEKVAQLAEDQCKRFLAESAIRAIVSSRAKDSVRLRMKLDKRIQEDGKKYDSVDDIRDDIHDLSGVRIALYSPTDAATVGKRITELFKVHDVRTFPDKRASEDGRLGGEASGYLATHYRVYMQNDSLNGTDKGLSTDLIEIQVASLLMHAWSEVEHDLRYKPLSGKPSPTEMILLDSLNDLIIAGETALIRLQRATNERIEGRDEPFEDPYNLAAYLHNTLQQQRNGEPIAQIGRTELLFAFLKELGLDRPKQLRSLLSAVYEDYGRSINTVSSQLVDIILMRDVSLLGTFELVRRNLQYSTDEDSEVPADTLFDFYEEWIVCVMSFPYLGGPVMSPEYRPSENLRSFFRAAFVEDEEHRDTIAEARMAYAKLIQDVGDIGSVLHGLEELSDRLWAANKLRLPHLEQDKQVLVKEVRERIDRVRNETSFASPE